LLVSPISRTSLYLGKLVANLMFVAVVECVALPLFVLFFDVSVWRVLAPLIAVIALATVGFVAVGTLFSAMVIRTRFAELMLPVLLLPFFIPPLTGAELATGLVGHAGVFYLFLKDPRLDRFAAASAEAGTVFAAIVLTTGPIWGKPIWGTWWTWDARLTLTLLLFFLYMGYLFLGTATPDPALRARYSAVLGICGLVLVPFIHL